MAETTSEHTQKEFISTTFKKSSYCQDGGCIEVASSQDGSTVYVRDNKKLNRDPLVFTKSEWEVFVKGVKNNEFDVN